MRNTNSSFWEKPALLFATTIAVFLATIIPVVILRPFWYDELTVQWIAGAASVGEAMERIRTGVEPVPPLFLFVQYLSAHLFGLAEWTARLLSIVGYVVSLTFLYLFVARRLDAIGGATAMAIMIVSGTNYYAQDGRPYALVFGCAALAMWAWQQHNERESPGYAALCGMALFTAASLHYYAVLLIAPFAAGELARWWQRRRVDWKMAFAVAAPGIALAVHLPLIRMILDRQSNPAYTWSKPTLAFPAKFWVRALEPGILVFVGIVLLIAYLWRFSGEMPGEFTAKMPDSELALLAGFVLLPVAGVVFAKLFTNAIVPRYVFSAVLGFSALAAHVLARVVRRGRIWIVFLLLVAVAGNGLTDIRELRREPTPGQLDIPVVAEGAALPVVIDDYLLYAQLSYYASPELLSRLVYLTDPERLARYTHAGQMELITVVGTQKGQFRGQAGYLAPYLTSHSRFLLFEPLRPEPEESWLAHDLLDRGAGLRVVAIQGRGRWYLVEQR